jgi:hypothetical protein
MIDAPPDTLILSAEIMVIALNEVADRASPLGWGVSIRV